MEKVADGVWLLRGDARKAMNIYFLEDGDGVVQFDAGTKAMVKKARTGGEELGGVKRIVLGHAHADHRGTAPSLDAPVYCHPDEVAHAEVEGALWSYLDLSQLPVPSRWIYPALLRRWDDGAVKIDGTVSEGDDVAGFRVIHFPGHAPGQIGLWRESDRLAFPTPLGAGTTARPRSRYASWRRWSQWSFAPGTTSRCAARTCVRPWSERLRSIEPRRRPPPRCHSFRP